MSKISEYLQKKYEPYRGEIPSECLEYETLATQTKIFTLKRRTAKKIGCSNCPKFLDHETFIEVVEDYLHQLLQK